MQERHWLLGLTGAAGAVLLSASAGWACVSANGPSQGEVVPNKAPVFAAARVSGAGWSASSPVEIGWASSPSSEVTHAATAVADPSGNLTATVQVPQAEPGYYYVVATQGATIKAMPFEVTGPRTAPANATAAPATDPRTSQPWNGLKADDPNARGLNDLPATHNTSSATPTLAIAGGVTVLFAGLALAEVRRRRVAAHAR